MKRHRQLVLPGVEAAQRKPMTDAIARPRKGARVKIHSRWCPRNVWTLHRVPGRPDGPVLAVRRRVLRDDCMIVFETPAGEAIANEDRLGFEDGTDRTHGFLHDCGGDDDYDGPMGQELSLDVFDHKPTAAERAAWLARRKIEQAVVTKPPSTVWGAVPGTGPVDEDGDVADRAVRRRVHLVHGFMATRYSVAVEGAPLAVDLRDLAVNGVVSFVGGSFEKTVPEVLRVWLKKPAAAQLKESGALRGVRQRGVDQEKRHETENRARQQANEAAWREVVDGVRRDPHEQGKRAVRWLGLDPSTVTRDDVQAAFRSRAKTGHADHGGAADMAELVRQRDAALAWTAAREERAS